MKEYIAPEAEIVMFTTEEAIFDSTELGDNPVPWG